MASSSASPSNADDRQEFSSLDSKEVNDILRVKHNDPEFTEIGLATLWRLGGRATRRLGHIIGKSTYLEHIFLSNSRLNVLAVEVERGELAAELYDALRFNQTIKALSIAGVNLGGSRFSILSSTLSSNLNLQTIQLINCNIDATAINLLSDALSERSKKTLMSLCLSYNPFGDVDVGKLVGTVKGIKFLSFDNTGIGINGCASIAQLLCDRRSGLISLSLVGNSIDDTAVAILVESSARNRELMTLNLEGNSSITAIGWQKILKLICDGSSIDACLESNHTLNSLGLLGEERLSRIMGSDSANLLRASLKMNMKWNRAFIVRHKVMWSHARGDLNIGEDSSIDDCVVLRVLGWIGDGSNESNAQLIQYHDPPLPKARMDVIRLDSFYRIVRARPDILCSRISCPRCMCQKRKRID